MPDLGAFTVRIEAFEDAGALWELGLNEVARFQFAREATIAGAAKLAELERSAAHFDRDLVLGCDPDARDDSVRAVRERRAQVRVWLGEQAGQLSADPVAHIDSLNGDPALYGLVEEFLTGHGLAELERGFTAAFVSNPGAGEVVKGHAIVLAELGLCPYHGKIVRDPDLFSGAWARSHRAQHLLWRLALTQELLAGLQASGLMLYRAASSEETLTSRHPSSLVSATFSRAVAEEHFEGGPRTRAAVLARQILPIDRAFMTFLETRAMNEQFHEAEAVLLADPANEVF
jgi:hypothetical protein